MLYKRQGIPDQDEIVLCKVTQIFPNSVFVELLEFGKQGMVHISEVSPGRIRNLRDFVDVGREIVCKVLRIDKERGHIDLSLRRVNSHQRQEKLNEIKQELKAETVIKNLAKKLNIPEQKLYADVTSKLFTDYSHLYLCFKDIVSGEVKLEELGLDLKIAQEITAAVIDKFKPEKISLPVEIKLQSYASDGVEKIKSLLQNIENISPTIRISYLGSGRYRIVIEDVDYKPAEKTLEKVQLQAEKFNDKLSTAVLEREKEE